MSAEYLAGLRTYWNGIGPENDPHACSPATSSAKGSAVSSETFIALSIKVNSG